MCPPTLLSSFVCVCACVCTCVCTCVCVLSCVAEQANLHKKACTIHHICYCCIICAFEGSHFNPGYFKLRHHNVDPSPTERVSFCLLALGAQSRTCVGLARTIDTFIKFIAGIYQYQIPYLTRTHPAPQISEILVRSRTFSAPSKYIYFCFSRINPTESLALFSTNKLYKRIK